MSETSPLFCQRCGRTLHPGEGDFYLVKIEGMADPSPPSLPEGASEVDVAGEIERLVEQISEHSEQELMDQVYRRLTLYLCGACFRVWIENPTG